MKKIGCRKTFQIGYNKVLDCPINFQCGISREYGKIMLCQYCKNKMEYYNKSQEREE